MQGTVPLFRVVAVLAVVALRVEPLQQSMMMKKVDVVYLGCRSWLSGKDLDLATQQGGLVG